MPSAARASSRTYRVFVSYARSDGAAFAQALREKLIAAGIPVWQDRVGLEGGRDWWLQITYAIEQVEFMVLVMTPAAMGSDYVRKEWRYARQAGVCIYPVKAGTQAEFDTLIPTLPRWMRDVQFYDLGFDPKHLTKGPEWPLFLNNLNTRCETPRVPFMVEDLPADFVPRPKAFQPLVQALVDEKREEPKAITAALKGAGGYGKTTLARALCHDARVQEAFDDGILWVTLGEKLSENDLSAKVDGLVYALTGHPSEAPNLEAAVNRLKELLEDRDLLLVIDDAWNPLHLRPFLQGGKRCARLITTRNSDTLPAETLKLPVDAMESSEAVMLLGMGLPDGEAKALAALAAQLGEWALLLKLANGVLRRRVEQGQSPAQAVQYAQTALLKKGLKAFDAHDPIERNQAASITLEVSLDSLTAAEPGRFTELAIFPEDQHIPLAAVQRLWQATGNLDEFDTEELCSFLYTRSLRLDLDLNTRTLRLHDVVRKHLRDTHQAPLPRPNQQFLEAHGFAHWAQLPSKNMMSWSLKNTTGSIEGRPMRDA